MTIRNLMLAGVAALALASLGDVTASQAHHAFAAEFDSQQPVKVQGIVTKFQFVNPHSWVYVDVKNKDGSATNWGFEFGTPNTLQAKGISRQTVKPGTELAIEGYKAKNGGAFGYSNIVTLPDGRAVHVGSAPDAPTVR